MDRGNIFIYFSYHDLYDFSNCVSFLWLFGEIITNEIMLTLVFSSHLLNETVKILNIKVVGVWYGQIEWYVIYPLFKMSVLKGTPPPKEIWKFPKYQNYQIFTLIRLYRLQYFVKLYQTWNVSSHIICGHVCQIWRLYH